MSISVAAKFLLAIFLSAIPASQAFGQERWSVDLRGYGYHEWRKDSYVSETRVAAAKDTIAVAIGNIDPATKHDPPPQMYEVFLNFFDQNTGKLTAKGGPWRGDAFFELFATAQGNFFLHLRRPREPTNGTGDTLLLLSSRGQELQRRDLPAVRRNQTAALYKVLHSASEKTLLLEWYDDSGDQYEVLDPNTLGATSKWSSPIGTPMVAAISDAELLGFEDKLPAKDTMPDVVLKNPGLKYDLFVRTWESEWQPFPARFYMGHFGWPPLGMGGFFLPNHTAFLSDELVAGEVGGYASEAVLKIVRTDGTEVLSRKIEHAGELSVSPDGQYFGFVYVSLSAFNLWMNRTFDMQFWPDNIELALWQTSPPAPMTKITLGRQVSGYCLILDASFVYVDGGRLKVIRLPVIPERTSPRPH